MSPVLIMDWDDSQYLISLFGKRGELEEQKFLPHVWYEK